MVSHYISQENDAGYAIALIESAIAYAQKFPAARYYGDSGRLAEASLALMLLSREVIALHNDRQQAAE